MITLADVNLWLALAFESHVHHIAAKARFDAYLAAFARAANRAVVTFDHAFGQYADVQCTKLP
jgi:predicted nucleic acid-binding protein